jgi:hypothetical protein
MKKLSVPVPVSVRSKLPWQSASLAARCRIGPSKGQILGARLSATDTGTGTDNSYAGA